LYLELAAEWHNVAISAEITAEAEDAGAVPNRKPNTKGSKKEKRQDNPDQEDVSVVAL
jgi:hypothetical protein